MAAGCRLSWQGRVLAASCERQVGGGLVWCQHGMVEGWVEEGARASAREPRAEARGLAGAPR